MDGDGPHIKQLNAQLEGVTTALEASERRFRLLFDGAPDAVLLADTVSGIILDANAAAARLLERPRAEIVGWHHTRLYPPRLAARALENFRRYVDEAKSERPSRPFETVVLRPDGTEVPVEGRAQVISDLDGHPVIQGVFRDLSRRKEILLELHRARADLEDQFKRRSDSLRRAIARLKAEIQRRRDVEADLITQQENIAALLNASTDSMLLLDPNGRILHANLVAADRLGVKLADFLGTCLFDYMPGPVRERRAAFLQHVLATGEDARFEDSRGRMFFDTHYYPVRGADATIRAVAVHARDVTAWQAAEAGLLSQTGVLAERVKELQCLYGVARLRDVGEQDLEQFGRGVIERVQAAMQHPEQASARMVLRGRTYASANHRDTSCRIGCDIMVHGKARGTLEAAYPGRDGEDAAGAFLPEELELLDTVSNIIGRLLEARLYARRLAAREKALRLWDQRLSETDAALQVLLRQRAADRRELQETVLADFKEGLLPQIHEMVTTGSLARREALAEDMELRLCTFSGAFKDRLSAKRYRLSPVEIQVAQMVREGLKSREIAGNLKLAPKTVEVHRRNLRRKLGLSSRRSNLRRHLLLLAD